MTPGPGPAQPADPRPAGLPNPRPAQPGDPKAAHQADLGPALQPDPEAAGPIEPGPARPSDPPILVSACLAGLRTRHDGESRPDPRIVDLVARGRAIPVCPEQLGGLPTPREPANLVPGCPFRVVTVSGADVTDHFRRGAEETLRLARLTGARRAILKERSPSCGTGQTWQIDPETGEPCLAAGRGVTAGLLDQAGLELFSEDSWPGPRDPADAG